jgi:alanine-glyoxylate transaminase/serine-glyoxylate transaminase/serine-pyruvate transaminase
MDAARHPALLMVDTISGLACADYRHDEWGVDVAISGSQKGLMLPPGISFNALSPRALEALKGATLPRSFWAWDEILEANKNGYWPYTPNTNLLYGLSESLDMIQPIQCADPRLYSPVLTGIITPPDVDADALRRLIYERFDMSLGVGLGKIKGRMFRIGHLGDSNDLTILATLAGCEMGFKLMGVKISSSGVNAAMDYLSTHRTDSMLQTVA